MVPSYIVRRGDILIVDFNPIRGHEQNGFRPAAVLSSDRMNSGPLGLVMVVPGTTSARRNSSGIIVPNHLEVAPTPINGLNFTTYFMGEQLRSVSVERLGKKLGNLTAEELYRLGDIEIMLLDLCPE